MEQNKPLPNSLLEAVKFFSDKDIARDFFAGIRWPDGPICPVEGCGSTNVGFLKSRKIWKCRQCSKQFSVKLGTIFEDSPIGLEKWLPAVWLIANCKNGISSYELARALGVTQKSAWFMLHRIRLAMQSGSFDKKLCGDVEVDETWIGGKARNMHAKHKRFKLMGKMGGSVGKTGVQGFLQRNGEVRAEVVRDGKKKTLVPNVRKHVEGGANLFTDDASAYFGLSAEYTHGVINHAEAYVDGQIHTNGLENFWSLLKRGLGGTYISVEPFHLFRYIDEQVFRYNNRKEVNDLGRFTKVLRQVAGRRITYEQLTGKDGESDATMN